MIKRSRQRNYRRNDDIIYHQDFQKKHTTSIIYQLDASALNSSSFTLNETNGNLYYDDIIEDTQEFENGSLINNVVPYKYIWIEANNSMELIANCPTVIDSEFFNLDQQTGNFSFII